MIRLVWTELVKIIQLACKDSVAENSRGIYVAAVKKDIPFILIIRDVWSADLDFGFG